MNQYVNRINSMNFNELREELSMTSGNPVKELLIRKLMKKKYYEHLNRKKMIESKKRYNQKNANQKKKRYNNNSTIDEISTIMASDILNDIERRSQNNFSQDKNEVLSILDNLDEDTLNGNSEVPLNDLDPRAKMFDNKFIEELERDEMNNHLMDRLNSDIYIKDVAKSKRNRFETPFSNSPDDKYASFQMDPTIIPPKSFSIKKITRENH